MSKHADDVEKFYSHGAERRAAEANGFLSFGYWPEGTKDYAEAVENLLELLLDEAAIEDPRVILNVCSGNGIETARIYDRLKPERIHGLDITRAHIESSRKRAKELGLEDKMVFHHGDATKTPFEDASFSHVIGVEGIAHFHTREKFFAEAHRVLEPGGMLMLSDSILKRLPPGLVEEATALACAKLWYVPNENRIDAAEYAEQLERHGFRVEFVRAIGDKVFPGFAKYNVTREAIMNNIDVRGVPVGLGLAFICWLLGHVYKRGVSDYVLVKAFKR